MIKKVEKMGIQNQINQSNEPDNQHIKNTDAILINTTDTYSKSKCDVQNANLTDKDVVILAIETSCDETAAAVIKNGRTVLSNIISSQIALHTLYGGVVPEIASRKHMEQINQVIEMALSEAKLTLDDITAIGVTYGPGLVGALWLELQKRKQFPLQRIFH